MKANLEEEKSPSRRKTIMKGNSDSEGEKILGEKGHNGRKF